MKAKVAVAVMVLIWAGLLAAAAVFDCAVLVRERAARVAEADARVQALEERFLAGLPLPRETVGRIYGVEAAAYANARDPAERREAFDRLAATVAGLLRQLGGMEAPLGMSQGDELSGLLNRRRIVRRELDAAIEDYGRFAAGPRGRIGRWWAGLPPTYAGAPASP